MITLNTRSDNLEALKTSGYRQRQFLYDELICQSGNVLTDEIAAKMFRDRSKNNQYEIIRLLKQYRPADLVKFLSKVASEDWDIETSTIIALIETKQQFDLRTDLVKLIQWTAHRSVEKFKLLLEYYFSLGNTLKDLHNRISIQYDPELWKHIVSIHPVEELYSEFFKNNKYTSNKNYWDIIAKILQRYFDVKDYSQLVSSIMHNNMHSSFSHSNSNPVRILGIKALCELQHQGLKAEIQPGRFVSPETVLRRYFISQRGPVLSKSLVSQIMNIFPEFYMLEDMLTDRMLLDLFFERDYDSAVLFFKREHECFTAVNFLSDIITHAMRNNDSKTIEFCLQKLRSITDYELLRIIPILTDLDLIFKSYMVAHRSADVRLAGINRLVELGFPKSGLKNYRDASPRVRTVIREYLT